ncbi:Cupin 2 conserved barrel domain protein [Natrinema gari JCM 14663]|uniref:Cupin 2 conserved barrel domain protein n=1 Tax=Natrinema gari JCM 14663 TaxID=1230459 RepID=L9YWI5_9EURY|nr:Cupin 2 conserved barrel domain protein [Natrinema gari JCM 14663]
MSPALRFRALDDFFDTDAVTLNRWDFEPGEEIHYHAHATQEQSYYVLEGEFSLKLGRSGEEASIAAGSGRSGSPSRQSATATATSATGRVVLAVGAPAVDDLGLDPHELEDDGDDRPPRAGAPSGVVRVEIVEYPRGFGHRHAPIVVDDDRHLSLTGYSFDLVSFRVQSLDPDAFVVDVEFLESIHDVFTVRTALETVERYHTSRYGSGRQKNTFR